MLNFPKNSLDLPSNTIPHSVERRADGSTADDMRPEGAGNEERQIDSETKRMWDILIDMAFRKIMARAGNTKVAKEGRV
jgi:hypothetical protein